MKKCFYFPAWEEQKDVMISLDEKEIFVNCKPIYSDKLILAQQVELNSFEINFKLYKQSTPSDPILAKLCERVGSKMYGDYVITSDCVVYVASGDFPEAIYIIQQYSLFLQGKENKWEEVKNILGI
jgi:hypothetical protein